MRIGLIGAGSLGVHLAKAFHTSNLSVIQIITRNPVKGEELAKRVGAAYGNSPEELDSDCSLVILAVPDQAILEMVERLPAGEYSLIHTSGSTSLDVLKAKGKDQGVFYPLQSFSAGREPSWAEIPVFIEASSPEFMETLNKLAVQMSATAYPIDSNARSHIHLAAVFASNFTNHLIHLSQEIMGDFGLPKSLLSPLIRETFEKALEIGALAAQTGPAKRVDDATMEKQLDLVSYHELKYEIYKLLSKSIREAEQ